MTSANSDRPVAVLTGAAKGIGLASAHRLMASGFAIVLVDIHEDDLRNAVASLGGGDGIMAVANDVRSYAGTMEAAQDVMRRFGRIDVLVNSAGVSQPKPLLEISEEEWDFVIDVNLKGTFNWCKAVARHMVEARRGRIINISSVNAHTGGGPSAVSKFAYAASKSGVLGLTRGLARELAPHVAVNAVCPGLVETALTSRMISNQGGENISRAIPMGRIGNPDDIAVFVNMLATIEPNYMTGEIIDVDGGGAIN